MNWHSLAARTTILAASTWSAALQLWSPTSLAYRAAGPSAILDWLNLGLLALSAIAWADVLWHDMGGRLIWPSLDARRRHQACVGLFCLLAGGFGIRAFVATGDATAMIWIGFYYVLMACAIAAEAIAIALEPRHE